MKTINNDKSKSRFSLISFAAKLIDKLAKARRNREVAWELSGMDDRMLADIGINRSDISSVARGHYPKRYAHSSPLMVYTKAAPVEVETFSDDHLRAA